MWYEETNMKLFDVFGLAMGIFSILSGGLLFIGICTSGFLEIHEQRFVAIPFVVSQMLFVTADASFVVNFWNAEHYSGVENALTWKGLDTTLCGIALRIITVIFCVAFV